MPVFKLWLAANERPRVNAEDDAIWRRIVQVPFTNVIPDAERDERVKIRLRTDPDVQAAILTWAVKGCLEWQQRGLQIPAIVRDYTAQYRAENDLIRNWLEDRCQLDPAAWTPAKELRESYIGWCEENGEKPLNPKTLGEFLTSRDCAQEKRRNVRGWAGVRVG